MDDGLGSLEVGQDRCPPLRLRTGAEIADPLALARLFIAEDGSYQNYDLVEVSKDNSLSERDVRVANRIIARMGAETVAAILSRSAPAAAALARIPPDASLVDQESEVPWKALDDLYRVFEGLPGVGLPRITKVLHKKRPGLIPILDSVVDRYLVSVDGPVTGGLAPRDRIDPRLQGGNRSLPPGAEVRPGRAPGGEHRSDGMSASRHLPVGVLGAVRSTLASARGSCSESPDSSGADCTNRRPPDRDRGRGDLPRCGGRLSGLDHPPSRGMGGELHAVAESWLPGIAPSRLLDDRGEGSRQLHDTGVHQGLLGAPLDARLLGGGLGWRRTHLVWVLRGPARPRGSVDGGSSLAGLR